MADELENVKRAQEVANRPRPQQPIPAGLQSHEYSNVSYKAAAPQSKPKSDEEKSLEWNAQQRKVAEAQ